MKSFRGERLRTARFASGGIEDDRRYMLMDQSEMRRGKVLTARQSPALLGNSASVADGVVSVRMADGATLRSDATDFAEALARAIGRPISLHEDRRGENHDDSDVLVINLASLRAVSGQYGAPRDPLRFRPNIMLDGPDAKPFEETAWIGKRFVVGDVELEAIKPDQRCMMTTIDPDTLAIDPPFLRYIVERLDGNFGVYCRVITPGTVREGDVWRAA